MGGNAALFKVKIMEIGKKYQIKPGLANAFVQADGINKSLVELIGQNGCWFTVDEMSEHDGEKFVDVVTFANGTEAGHNYDTEYFELQESEFEFFEEIDSSLNVVNDGVNSINITVTKDNAKDMINLLQTIFKK